MHSCRRGTNNGHALAARQRLALSVSAATDTQANAAAADTLSTLPILPLQTRLLNASESLLDQSQDMNELLRVLMHYQAKGNTILTQLQGSSISLHDVLFYTLALCIPLVFITYPSDVRMLLLAGVLACWGLERAVLQHYVMLFGALRNASKAAADGSVSVGAVGSWSGVQDVKVAVRMLVLGGTLAVVVWLLLKRRAANNRKDAIFQAIQHSVSATGPAMPCVPVAGTTIASQLSRACAALSSTVFAPPPWHPSVVDCLLPCHLAATVP